MHVADRIRLNAHIDPEMFERLCALNPELRLELTSQGGLDIMSPAGSNAGRRNARLTARLVVWALDDGTGEAFDSSAGFTLPNGAIRSPDASWIRLDRWNSLPTAVRESGFVPLCPDFVVELRSPSDSVRDLHGKMLEYMDQGARLGWLIDPVDRTATVYRPGREPETLRRPATLSGEDVLPGFVLDLKSILD